MKLEHVLRKAAPFLLIAILIACLFIQPQKEGMKGIDHYMKQGVDDGKDYYHSVDNVGKDYHTYESSPTHQWLKNAGSDNKYAKDIHEYTIYKPADHWLNSKPGLKTTFNIYKAWQNLQSGNADFKSEDPEIQARAESIKKFEDLPERDELYHEFGHPEAEKKFEDLPERDELTEADFDPNVSGEGMLQQAPAAAKTDDLTSPKEIPSHYRDMAKEVKESPVQATRNTIQDAAEDPDLFADEVIGAGGDGD